MTNPVVPMPSAPKKLVVTDVLAIIKLVEEIFAPIIEKAMENAMSGGNPLDAVRDENVADILPEHSQTELAMLQARAGLR